MRGACGVDIDKDRIFLSFAVLKKRVPVFVGESQIVNGLGEGDIIKFLQDNVEILAREIAAAQEKYSLQIEKLFLKLPAGLEKMNLVEEVVVLKRAKKINPHDIVFIKKYLEDNTLDWDDYCIHHFPLDFGVEGKAFTNLPVGLWARRIRVKSLLITVKDRLRMQIEDIFNNYNVIFGGFVSSGVSDYSCVFSGGDKNGVQAVVRVGYDGSFLTIVEKGVIRSSESFCFGLKYIIEHIAKSFSLPIALADEIFTRYISFQSERSSSGTFSPGKEISVKDGDIYINLSMDSVNNIVMNFVQENISTIISRADYANLPEISFSFLGRLNQKEEFIDFLKTFVKHQITPLPQACSVSSSWGCVRYGVLKFLENRVQPKVSLLDRISKIYKDYF